MTPCNDTMYRIHTGWSKKTDTQFYFWDNFGNSAPLLTILSLLQAKFMARKREVLPPTALLLCDHSCFYMKSLAS